MKIEKVNRLLEAKKKLKSDFVGLDEIIDKIIDSITPWYVTPEILEKPTVISMWGLTGTGKTSLIRKLVRYLDIADKSLFFDCGEQGGESDLKLFSEKLDSLFESSPVRKEDPRFSDNNLKELGIEVEKDEKEPINSDPLDYTFVFDEFQYMNTKNPCTGEEDNKPEGRAIWGLMDSGYIDINQFGYRKKSLVDFMEDLKLLSEEFPETKLKSGRFESSMTPVIRSRLSSCWYEEDEGDGLPVFTRDDLSFFLRQLNFFSKNLGSKVGAKLNSFTTLHEFVEYAEKYVCLLSKPKIINCSKSLIFILGNLDEAFDLTDGDMDPDIDADVYHEITSNVSYLDIKASLRKRFRDEQIGRLGNNIIIYPSLKRKDFEEVIDRELKRIVRVFEETTGNKVEISENLRKLIYLEGCIPVQGVRPIFSTINTFISPLLSMIVMVNDEGKREYLADTKGDNFNVPKITLQIKRDGEVMGERDMNLNIGSLKSPERCKKIGLQAVHEASHAVLYYYLTGKCPSAIIASNVFRDGGYMMNAVDLDSSTESIRDLRVDVIVSLAGYYGEREFFKPEMCSLGASSDISKVWENLRNAFYDSGLKIPMKFSEVSVSSENDGKPFGLPEGSEKINNSLMSYFEELTEETKKLIHQERRAIKEVSLKLIEDRSLGMEDFKKLVDQNLTQKPDIPDDNYYINTLRKDGEQQ